MELRASPREIVSNHNTHVILVRSVELYLGGIVPKGEEVGYAAVIVVGESVVRLLHEVLEQRLGVGKLNSVSENGVERLDREHKWGCSLLTQVTRD